MNIPDIREVEELVGCAVNASALRLDPDSERPLDRIAAFAMALRQAAQVPSASEMRALDAELGRSLWHAAYGGDALARRTAEIALAMALKARRSSRMLKALGEHPECAEPVARRVVSEWVDATCKACGGTGRQELVGMKRQRPRGQLGHGRLVPCAACDGCGRARVSKAARRMAVSGARAPIDPQTFVRDWDPVFRYAAWYCDSVAGNLRGPSVRALGRRRP